MIEKIYIVLRKQSADGCDHSIACGKDYNIEKSSLDIDSFIFQKVISSLFHGDNPDLEQYNVINMDNFVEELKVIDLSEGKIYNIDMNEQAKKYTEYFKKRDADNEEKAEIELLKKLQKKHGFNL